MGRVKSLIRNCQVRGRANRDASRSLAGRARDARSSGELSKLPDVKERPCPLSNHTSIGAYSLGAVSCPLARARDRPSARLSQAAHPRQGGLREAGASFGLRLRLLADRRSVVLGHHSQTQTRRVDRGRSDGHSGGGSARSLRPDYRSGTLGRGRRLLHNEGPMRRREGR
jgi:hypothetical protein